MMWRCPKLFRYWEGVIDSLRDVFGIVLEKEAKECILGYRGIQGERKSTTLAILRGLFQARKTITLRWQSKEPPIVRDQIVILKETLCRERTEYIKRGNLKDFDKMWRPWLEKVGGS